MNKKGDVVSLPTNLLIEVTLGIIVAVIFVFSAAAPDSLSNVNKIYAQEDLSLLSETIDGAPGYVKYDYNLKSSYKVSTEEGKVTITQSTGVLDGSFSSRNVTLEKEMGKPIGVKHG